MWWVAYYEINRHNSKLKSNQQKLVCKCTLNDGTKDSLSLWMKEAKSIRQFNVFITKAFINNLPFQIFEKVIEYMGIVCL